MAAATDDAPPQDPTAASTTWQDSVAGLSALLGGEGVGGPSHKSSAGKIERACQAILERASATGDGGDAAAGGDDDVLPDAVRGIVTTAYLRALIPLQKFAAVVDHCQAHFVRENGDTSCVEEEAYALYRLRRYDACRQLCEAVLDGENGGSNSSSSSRGLRHIHAQALYRLGETGKVDDAYRQLLLGGDEAEDPAAMDVDEREDALANALANRAANYTPGSLLGAADPWVEGEASLQQLLAEYGSSSPQKEDGEDEELLQDFNYDLAYNLATYLLVSSDARDRSHVLKAKHLLGHAEASALTVLASSSASPEEDNEDADDEEARAAKIAKEVERRKAQQLAEKEADPIRANLALAQLLLGGDENETEALRGYVTLVTKAAKSKGKQGAAEANLAAAASNNLALLRDGKESVFDTVKKIPTTSSLSVSEDVVSGGGKGGKKGSSKDNKGGEKSATAATAAVPLAGATPQQARVALFNRALLFAKMGNERGCQEALEALRASLRVSYHGDEGEKKKTTGGASSKGKKKKGGVAASPGQGEGGDVPTAMPASEAEAIAWAARTSLVESELYRTSESKDHSPVDILNEAIAKLDNNDDASGALAFVKSQLLLHKAAADNPKSDARPLVEALDALPSMVKSCPGTTVTLASLHASQKNDQEAEGLLSSLGDKDAAKLAVAEFKMERGEYEGAVELLEGIVDNGGGSVEATALLVKALSYTDPSRAEEYVGILQEAMDAEAAGGDYDGEALESMEIPRFAKKALGESAGGGAGSSKVRKMIAATGKRGSNLGEKKKKNREAILRKRARQREAYLAHLESEGRYDPNKTPQTKPDPERWIPKSQRSYNRRGRGRGRHKSNVGAQGGGAGAGMEKDAARLDVAARAAEKKSGGGDGSGKPSTANIKVSSSGTARKGKGGRRR